MIRFFIAIMMAAVSFSGFAATAEMVISFDQENTITVPNRNQDGSPDPMHGRFVSWRATLTVHFIPKEDQSPEEVYQRVDMALGNRFRSSYEGAQCYTGRKEAVWWGIHVREVLRDSKVPVAQVRRVIYTCQRV